MNLRKGEPVGKSGKIIPVHHNDYVGQPVIGYYVKLDGGYYAFATGHPVYRCDSETEAVEYIGKRYAR